MQNQKRLTDFSDLKQLLPESEQHQPVAPEGKKRIYAHNGKGKTVRVTLDTKGRKGKTVTLISGFQHNPQTMEEIAKILKQHCGAGGTVKDKTIEIQGDQRNRVTEKLMALNYIVK